MNKLILLDGSVYNNFGHCMFEYILYDPNHQVSEVKTFHTAFDIQSPVWIFKTDPTFSEEIAERRKEFSETQILLGFNQYYNE
ncbi:MAG: hypothetical protein ACRCST_13485, partial [Turicibacter sp.]